jgi:hypothetical protein
MQEEGACVEAAVSHLSSLLAEMPGRSGWQVALHHVERVKWYAPRIRHLVSLLEQDNVIPVLKIRIALFDGCPAICVLYSIRLCA